MRKINWDEKLSGDDIAFIRQAGFVNGEDLIRANAQQFKVKVPEAETPNDIVTRGTVGAEAVGQPPAPVDPATGAPRRVEPTATVEDESDEDDDYDQWKSDELSAEVVARNKIAEEREDVSAVTVTPTGANGNVVKADMIKGLRLWDADNPGVL